jgi:uncharacterized delta-60 repeat protein
MKKLLFPLLLSYSVFTLSQYGFPDPNFGGDGIITVNIADTTSVAYAIACLPDGKILIAGYAYNGHDMDFALHRMFPDGSPDNTFGTNGIVLTDFSTHDDRATSMKIQPDGKIVLGGFANEGNSFAIARYNADGSPDSTFSTDGKVTPAEGSKTDFGPTLLLTSDGKILIAGSNYTNLDDYAAMVRYNPDGTIDNTFTPDNNVVKGTIYGAALQSDGKILLTGQVYDMSVDLLLARFNADGTVDNSFSFDGKLTYDYRVVDVGNGLAIQNDQKIIVTGYYYSAFYGIEQLRYESDGILDAGYATDGAYIYADPGYHPHRTYAVAVQPDQKILLAGSGYKESSNFGFELIRLNTDGSTDSTFGSGGMAYATEGNSSGAYSLCFQPDGKILACGYIYVPGYSRMAVIRFTSGLAPLGLEANIAETEITVFPNPFSDVLSVKTSESGKDAGIEILAMDGTLVYASILTEHSRLLHLGYLPPASYMLRLRYTDYAVTRLIVKM